LAAIMTNPNKYHFDLLFSIILLIIATITMVVVRLSSSADNQKLVMEIAHTKRLLGIEAKVFVMVKNPS
jgi:hypothetical protein